MENIILCFFGAIPDTIICFNKSLFNNSHVVSQLQASVNSDLIQCIYYLKVTTEYKSAVCSTATSIEISTIMNIPQDVRIDISTLKPANWDPVEMPLNILDIPSAEVIGIERGIKTSSYKVTASSNTLLFSN